MVRFHRFRDSLNDFGQNIASRYFRIKVVVCLYTLVYSIHINLACVWNVTLLSSDVMGCAAWLYMFIIYTTHTQRTETKRSHGKLFSSDHLRCVRLSTLAVDSLTYNKSCVNIWLKFNHKNISAVVWAGATKTMRSWLSSYQLLYVTDNNHNFLRFSLSLLHAAVTRRTICTPKLIIMDTDSCEKSITVAQRRRRRIWYVLLLFSIVFHECIPSISIQTTN